MGTDTEWDKSRQDNKEGYLGREKQIWRGSCVLASLSLIKRIENAGGW